jgi:hypothetical protein
MKTTEDFPFADAYPDNNPFKNTSFPRFAWGVMNDAHNESLYFICAAKKIDTNHPFGEYNFIGGPKEQLIQFNDKTESVLCVAPTTVKYDSSKFAVANFGEEIFDQVFVLPSISGDIEIHQDELTNSYQTCVSFNSTICDDWFAGQGYWVSKRNG